MSPQASLWPKRVGLQPNPTGIKNAAILGADGLKIAAAQNNFRLLNRSSEISGSLDRFAKMISLFLLYGSLGRKNALERHPQLGKGNEVRRHT